MKKSLAILALLVSCTMGHASMWYATCATPSTVTNINTTGTWVPTSTGSGTGSGIALVWGAQGANDTFNANGCTALAVNVDPGLNLTTLTGIVTFTLNSTAVTGSGTLFTSQVAANDWIWLSGYGPVQVNSVTNDTALVLTTASPQFAGYPYPSGSGTAYDGIVTLKTDTTQGGDFTYATATNITIHARFVATKTTALVVSGTSGGGTIIGDGMGGTNSSTCYGISDGHTFATLNIFGSLVGGSGSVGIGYGWTGGPSAGATNVTGQWQGQFRYAPLDLAVLKKFITLDEQRSVEIARLYNINVKSARLAVTCLDQVGEKVTWYGERRERFSGKPESLLNHLDNIALVDYISYGPSANKVSEHHG